MRRLFKEIENLIKEKEKLSKFNSQLEIEQIMTVMNKFLSALFSGCISSDFKSKESFKISIQHSIDYFLENKLQMYEVLDDSEAPFTIPTIQTHLNFLSTGRNAENRKRSR